MNVDELKAILEPLAGDLPVVLSDVCHSDRAVGLHSVVQMRYLSQTAWGGFVVDPSQKTPEGSGIMLVLVLRAGPWGAVALGAEGPGSRGAGEQGSRGAGEQGSRGETIER